jgi:uncharacterized pyridoxal phosphate-containing UPF0001 family protein
MFQSLFSFYTRVSGKGAENEGLLGVSRDHNQDDQTSRSGNFGFGPGVCVEWVRSKQTMYEGKAGGDMFWHVIGQLNSNRTHALVGYRPLVWVLE